jgi:hypothetical protein
VLSPARQADATTTHSDRFEPIDDVSERLPVEKLWTKRAFPVHGSKGKKIFHRQPRDDLGVGARWTCVSYRASLDRRRTMRTISIRPTQSCATVPDVSRLVHRFEESIGGRAYLIEVAAVESNRWRAYLVKMPGVPTALMPFYGPTPDEAACHLRDWLRRAHARVAAQTRR